MTGDEHKPQKVVPDLVIDCSDQVRNRHLLRLKLPTEFIVFQLETFVAPDVIDSAVLRGPHQPRSRILRNTRRRPLLKRCHQSILRELLGDADVTYDPRKPGNKTGRLDPPHSVNRSMRLSSTHSTDQTIFRVAVASSDQHHRVKRDSKWI
jgi:hypothetical protein